MEKNSGMFFFTWSEALQAGIKSAGGKGWNLGRLEQYGFKIPAGGVLAAEAYQCFIEENNLLEDTGRIGQSVNIGNIGEKEIEQKLLPLREKIKSAHISSNIRDKLVSCLKAAGILDKPIAVRSSASAEDSAQASFAGIHESFLNVRGVDNILSAIKGCYASLWTPRAVAYRRKMGVKDAEVGQAVVIMEMVAARAAGVAFTCDPQTGREDIFVVNANFGLGESVVNGAIEPDTYCLDVSAFSAVPGLKAKKIGAKQGMTVAAASGGTHFVSYDNLASQQVLPDNDIEKLGLLLMRVFESLGECEEHQDMEWAFDGRDFVLLQARPVTALPCYTFEAIKDKPRIWSNGNYRDAVPMVISPLHRRVMKKSIDTIQFTSFSESGYPMPEGFQFSRLLKGRLYCDMSALQWAHYDSTGTLPKDFNPFWGGHQPEIEIEDTDPFKGEIGLARQSRIMKGASLIMEASANAASTFAEFTRSVESLIGDGFDRIPDQDFIDKYNELGQIVKEYCEKFTSLSGVGTWPLVLLLQKLSGYLGPRVMIVLNGLMVGGKSAITSADHGYRLIELAELARRDKAAVQYLTGNHFNPCSCSWEEYLPESSPFKQEFRNFIKEYGHRCVYELDIANPRWEEDPSYLMDIIKSIMATANPEQWKTRQREKFNQAWAEVAEKIPSEEHAGIQKGIKDAQDGAAVREMTKSVMVMALKAYRLMALELGDRFTQRGIIEKPDDIFYCSWSDLFSILYGNWHGDGLRNLVAARKASQREKEALSPPDVILGEKPVFSEPVDLGSGDFLPGVGAAAGKASGVARLIRHPGEGNRLRPGDVLVAPSTDPGWTPLFLKACAVVMETGGFLSHGSIVAREYGVPAVVNVPGAMQIIKEGRKIVVDGDKGKVFF
ncbi:PEP/pyruvate-binding domain-containing protein [Pelotomaculum sp. PtaB.Bin117]|uniref:PEP/pyruvate-binding domain-containing protein n=1 Tax=Pelotomaculum sp. PtaB.Bin117 TaxID=1811694 RepID=UPI0009D00339|nr:PEP/pyruvate-binding domain-containing protein [Pelotomaculum sp. PtaB.Bin117]OPX87120.1 MAG: Phosphoenolpyruvate synthase [Pelotomaculum sp. PtaB.Bin117]